VQRLNIITDKKAVRLGKAVKHWLAEHLHYHNAFLRLIHYLRVDLADMKDGAHQLVVFEI